MTDVNVKIRRGSYLPEKPYVCHSKDPIAHQAYLESQQQGITAFFSDLAKEHELTGHPRLVDLERIAWSFGHSSGFSEVKNYYDELAGLLKPKGDQR